MPTCGQTGGAMSLTPPSSIPTGGGGGGVVTQGTIPWVVDASSVPVPVTGPLTDAQLRAAVVPVGDGGGSLTVDGPLTNAELRAAVVPVGDGGGSLTVDGPLTNAELRAADVGV